MRLPLTLAALLLCTPAQAQTSPCDALREVSQLWISSFQESQGDYYILLATFLELSVNAQTRGASDTASSATGRILERTHEAMTQAQDVLARSGC